MRLPVILTIVLCACLSLAQSADRPPQQTAQTKQYFIAIFSRGTAWEDAKPAHEQIGFKEHSENLRRLRAEKRLAIGGRYGDKGMLIIEATSEDDARSLFVSDVMVSKKTFTLELHQFRPFYKGSIE